MPLRSALRTPGSAPRPRPPIVELPESPCTPDTPPLVYRSTRSLLQDWPLDVQLSPPSPGDPSGSGRGRHLVVELPDSRETGAGGSRPASVQVGATVLSCVPYAVAVDNAFLSRCCLGCAKLCESRHPLACADCPFAFYCSPACQQGAGWERHRPVCGYEGPLLQTLHELDERSGSPLRPQPPEECTLRLVLASILTYEETECESPPPRTRTRGGPTFGDVLAQASHDAQASARRRRLSALSHRALLEILPFEKQPSLEVVFGLFNRARANEVAFFTKENRRYATAFAPAAALANHSCIPSCVRLSGGGGRGWSTELRALRRLAAGEEVTISYLPLTMPVRDRRSTLEKLYNFTCDCDRCLAAEEGEEEPYPLEAHSGCGGTLYPYRAAGTASVSGLRCSVCEQAFADFPGRARGGGCCGLCLPPTRKAAVKTPPAAVVAAPAAMPSDTALSLDFCEEAVPLEVAEGAEADAAGEATPERAPQ